VQQLPEQQTRRSRANDCNLSPQRLSPSMTDKMP
jgi:hypothetical protein